MDFHQQHPPADITGLEMEIASRDRRRLRASPGHPPRLPALCSALPRGSQAPLLPPAPALTLHWLGAPPWADARGYPSQTGRGWTRQMLCMHKRAMKTNQGTACGN